MATIEIKPQKLNIALVHGDRPKPASITVQDFDGNPITVYTPVMEVVDKGVTKKSLTESSGLIHTGPKTSIDLPTDLKAGCYKHFIRITLPNAWAFTLYAGDYNIVNPWENGTTSVTFDFTVTLPVRAAEIGYYLLDENGNPILDNDNNPINTGNPNP